MPELNDDEVISLAMAAELKIPESELKDVRHTLNSMIEAIENINPENINDIEPLPIILPEEVNGNGQ